MLLTLGIYSNVNVTNKWIVKQTELLIGDPGITIGHKIYDTNSSFHVEYRTTGKV